MNTVPGPENLQTSPSPLLMPEMMPPLATRSITYLQFQATRWPLSMMYFSPSTSWGLYQQNVSRYDRMEAEPTSFRIIAPKLANHKIPVPLIL